MLRFLPALAFVSGICGLAYEQLYGRLLTTYLGDSFYVVSSLLTTFLLGIALGSLVARRMASQLWIIEALIGLFALAVTAGGPDGMIRMSSVVSSLGIAHHLAVQLCVAAFLTVPAVLIGFSVPLFAIYLGDAREQNAEGGFRVAYLLYNLGAAVCVLVIEFYLLRHLGLTRSLRAMALLNFIVAAAVYAVRKEILLRTLPPQSLAFSPTLAAVGVCGALSGVYQLLYFKFTEHFFGPFHENFSIVLATVLMGIALGTAAVRHHRIDFERLMGMGPLAFAASLLLIQPAVSVWAWAGDAFYLSGFWFLLLKVSLIGMIGLPAACWFGATIPAALQGHAEDSKAGSFLAVASFGNCVGYLLVTLVLYETLPLFWIATGIGAVLVVIAARMPRSPWTSARTAAGAIGIALAAWLWDPTLLALGYENFQSAKALRQAQSEFKDYTAYRHRESEVIVSRTQTGGQNVIINGYKSLSVGEGDHTNPIELLFGLLPRVYAPSSSEALVLGLGTGLTGGATAAVFDRMTAIEINPAMVDVIPTFAKHNLNVLGRKNVELVIDDGQAYLQRTQKRFDAIINTVTSPLYFSSGKLYTKDFFHLVKNRLVDKGVYALWFDGRAGETGARIIFRTLRESFAHCTLIHLRPQYTQVICSDAPMTAHYARLKDLPADLAEKLSFVDRIQIPGKKMDLVEFVRMMTLSDHRLASISIAEPANTFDMPRLEFEMAQRSAHRDHRWSPFRLVGADFASGFTPKDLETRCLMLRILADELSTACLADLARANAGRVPKAFLDDFLLFARQNPVSPEELVWLARNFEQRGDTAGVEDVLAGIGQAAISDTAFLLLHLEHGYRLKGRLPDGAKKLPAARRSELAKWIEQSTQRHADEDPLRILTEGKQAMVVPGPFREELRKIISL